MFISYYLQKMIERNLEQGSDMKFCLKIGKNANETFALLKWFIINMLWRISVYLRIADGSRKKEKTFMMTLEGCSRKDNGWMQRFIWKFTESLFAFHLIIISALLFSSSAFWKKSIILIIIYTIFYLFFLPISISCFRKLKE